MAPASLPHIGLVLDAAAPASVENPGFLPVFSLLGGASETDPEPPVITTLSISNAQVNSSFSFTFSVIGNSPRTYSVSSGSLPTGITLNSVTGELTGTTTSSGSYTFTLLVTNVAGEDSQIFTLIVENSGSGDGEIIPLPPGESPEPEVPYKTGYKRKVVIFYPEEDPNNTTYEKEWEEFIDPLRNI